jgi:hypothetical protein
MFEVADSDECDGPVLTGRGARRMSVAAKSDGVGCVCERGLLLTAIVEEKVVVVDGTR